MAKQSHDGLLRNQGGAVPLLKDCSTFGGLGAAREASPETNHATTREATVPPSAALLSATGLTGLVLVSLTMTLLI
jgi:hypothetical protein